MSQPTVTSTSSPTYPPGSTYSVPEPRRGAAFSPAQATPYDRLPRTLRWEWWRPLVALTVFGVLAVIGSVAVVGVAMVAVVLEGGAAGPAQLDALLDRLLAIDATDSLVLVLSLASIAVWLPAVAGALRIAGMRPIGHVSSVVLRLRWRWLLTCSVLAVATLALSLGLSFGLGALVGQNATPVWTSFDRLWLPLLIIILLVPFQAAAEEYVFRGVLVQALGSWLPRRAWSRVIVVVVPTIAFVLSHGYGLWGLLDVGVFALAAMWVTLRTGGLEAAIALHVVNNVVVFTALASGAFGTTVNGDEGGSLAGVLITVITSIGYCWIVEILANRRGLERTSSWPERGPVAPLALPVPHPVAGWTGTPTHDLVGSAR
ncbi:CPBP family intramembrane glutamic endopeptidase [Serinibacter arcticus]|uniref:CPBP family intramembrane glutamic endopeptidase n=1 Tax=Serinibacter arcticus TaxID=1655435 RepID=UPI0011B2599C|nr:type II CAAX endopeptidase family protein [Serinibacter arcticus]